MSGLIPNALHVARREYLVRVRGRAFLITTLLLAVAIVAVTMVPTILSAFDIADPPAIAVDVQADGLTTDPVVAIQAALILAADPEADPAFISGQTQLMVVGNDVGAQVLAKQDALKPEQKFQLLTSPSHIGLNKNEDRLKKAVNDAVAKMLADGKLDESSKAWLKTPLNPDNLKD